MAYDKKLAVEKDPHHAGTLRSARDFVVSTFSLF